MSRDVIDRIVQSVLYEGYMLYPYRHSSLKNQHRWNFGVVYPEGMDPSFMQTECLIEGNAAEKADDEVDVEIRFLQVFEKDSWHETVERSFSTGQPGVYPFAFDPIQGDVAIVRESIQPGLDKLRVTITNRTPPSPQCDPLLQSLVSTHTIFAARHGRFVSLSDPPECFREEAANCKNVGTWPVLAGREPDRRYILSSPIILYDYPRVADESPNDLFDCTEIDEILTLRILTLSDAEKEEMRRSGDRERRLLERAESLTPEQLLKLHGTMRDVRAGLKPGDRVRLRPKPGGDVFDIVLAGRIAIVESVQQDLENRTHVAVVIEDDPGKDLGLMQQPGHRFFFSSEELEVLL